LQTSGMLELGLMLFCLRGLYDPAG